MLTRDLPHPSVIQCRCHACNTGLYNAVKMNNERIRLNHPCAGNSHIHSGGGGGGGECVKAETKKSGFFSTNFPSKSYLRNER